MQEEINGFYLDDGTKVDPNLITKPGLCLSCINDDSPDSEEEILCTLTRIDQMSDEEFICYGFVPKDTSYKNNK